MVRVQKINLNSRQCLHVSEYLLPSQVAHLYNANGPFSLLVSIESGSQPMLHVPLWLRCRLGNPTHLNQSAPPDLAALGLKWACWHANWNEREYTTAALLNLIDEYFIGYPNAP